MSKPTCGQFIYLYDGEYEGNCELPPHDSGDHWDGWSWFRDEAGEWRFVDEDHDGVPSGSLGA